MVVADVLGMSQSSTTLVIMARYPAVGEVKTRLGHAIGAERACALYRAFLLDLDSRFSAGRRALVWAVLSAPDQFSALVSPGGRCLAQVGQDLGERMHNCFRRLLAEGAERVLIIGADAPHVRDAWLDEAEAELDSADVILGPAEDGGYYLIGMREPHEVFSGIQMGTPAVLAETLSRAERFGLRVRLLPKTFDVDELSDVLRLRQLLASGKAAPSLPRTTALLQSWGDAMSGEVR